MAKAKPPLTGGKRVLAIFLKSFIGLGTLFLAAELAVMAYPPLVLAGLAAFGRTPMCSTTDVLRGADQYYKQQQLREKIAAGTKLKQDDKAGFRLWSTPAGEFWNPSSSDGVLPVIVAQQEGNLYNLDGRGVQPGNIVIDCGAHIGLYTRRALRDGAKLVVAIEPAPDNLECLRRNLKAEIAAGKVIVVPKGVWDKEENLPFYENPENSAGDSFVGEPSKAKLKGILPLTTIDKLAAELKLERVDFIKMDIKGAVAKALVGGRGVIAAHHPRLAISTEESVDDPVSVASAVDRLGLGYKALCGSCTLVNGAVSPDVLFFR
ncbi:MAG: FkbM family methyltransferase [Bryobacterales bacterium]|nr:FkbM family methyltransferase [Bryobacterales bacterium]